jgi:hypothetical protein
LACHPKSMRGLAGRQSIRGIRVGITRADRRQGLHLIGQSGTGKSALMARMLVADIMAGEGVTLIDPHGHLAETVLDHIPPARMADVCYFNVADTERPVPFNILQTDGLPPDKHHLAVSAVLAAFSGIWGLTPERAPRLLNILKYAVAALLETSCRRRAGRSRGRCIGRAGMPRRTPRSGGAPW